MSFFDIAKSLEMFSVAEFYGIDVKKNMARCPFHDDHRASMSFKGNRWKCFVCNIGGDATDFVARMFALSPTDALKKLNSDFALGLDFQNTFADDTYIREITETREISKAFEKWENWAGNAVCSALRETRGVIQNLEPQENSHPAYEWLLALNALSRLEYLSEFWLEKGFEERLELFKHGREEINGIEKCRNIGKQF
jgi:DNA primase